MKNLSLALSNSLSTIPKFYNIYVEILDECKNTYSKMCSIDKESECYSSKVRALANDFVNKYGNNPKKYNKKKYKEFEFDYDLLMNNLNLISHNKHDESVIYNIHKFSVYTYQLKQLKKKYDWELDGLNGDTNEYLFDENYTLTANTHKLLGILNKYNDLLTKEYNKINTFSEIVKKNEDD